MPSAPDLTPAGPAPPVCHLPLLTLPRPGCTVAVSMSNRRSIPPQAPTRLLRDWIGRWQRLVSAAASHASDTLQPERLRDGSLLYRFSSPDEPAHGHALNGRSDVATLTSLPSAPWEAEALSSVAKVPPDGAGTDVQRRSKQGGRDSRESPQRQSRAGREPQAGRQGAGSSRAARGGSDGSGPGQAPAGHRNGAGRGSAPAQGRASRRQNGSAAQAAAHGQAAVELSRGHDAAEPRPSFMDIPPPQQQYRSMRVVPGANDSRTGCEGDDAASTGPTGRSAWKSRGRPQRVRTSYCTIMAPGSVADQAFKDRAQYARLCLIFAIVGAHPHPTACMVHSNMGERGGNIKAEPASVRRLDLTWRSQYHSCLLPIGPSLIHDFRQAAGVAAAAAGGA